MSGPNSGSKAGKGTNPVLYDTKLMMSHGFGDPEATSQSLGANGANGSDHVATSDSAVAKTVSAGFSEAQKASSQGKQSGQSGPESVEAQPEFEDSFSPEDVTVTSDDDPDVDSDDEAGSSEEDEGFFLDAGTSEYHSREDAIKGIKHKDEYIRDLETANEQRERQLAEFRDRQAIFKSLPDDIQEQLAVQALMPENLRGLTEQHFVIDKKDKRLYDEDGEFLTDKYIAATEKAAAAKAEWLRHRDQATAKVSQQKESAATIAQQLNQINKERQQKTKSLMDSVKPSFFGIGAKNPEDKRVVAQLLYQQIEDPEAKIRGSEKTAFTVHEAIRIIGETMGPEVAQLTLEGVKARFHAQKGKRVTKVTRELNPTAPTDTRPKRPSGPQSGDFGDAKANLSAGFAEAMKKTQS